MATEAGAGYISFSDALDQYNYLRNNDAKFKESSLVYIRGVLIKQSGDARAWIFGVKNGQDQYYLTFGGEKEPEIVLWRGTLPNTILLLDTITTPPELFELRSASIRGFFDGNSKINPNAYPVLELKDNLYYLRFDDAPLDSSYIFDARNGEIIKIP
jgi:hypothetical protein